MKIESNNKMMRVGTGQMANAADEYPDFVVIAQKKGLTHD